MRASSSHLPGVSSGMSIALATLLAVLVVTSGLVAASGPNGTVRGRITNSATSSGISGAYVRLDATDMGWTFQTTTDATGFFVLSVPNRLYTMTAWGSGYLTNSTSVGVGSGLTSWANMSVDPAGPLTVRLQGFVKDSGTSAPVTSGRIAAVPSAFATYQDSSALNASGFYSMNLTVGMYDVETVDILGYNPYTYYSLYLSTPQVRWLNISLTADPLVAWLNGTVRDSGNGTPIPGASITANAGGVHLSPTSTNATGAFSFHLPSGSVTITADAVGYGPATSSYYVFSGTTIVAVNLDPLSTHIRGYILDGLTGLGVPTAQLTASPFWSTGYYDIAAANAAGYYNLNLTVDDYDLNAAAPGYTHWYGSSFFSSSGIEWVNVTLWPIIASVNGYLVDALDGSHVPNLWVYATDTRSSYSISTRADASGYFHAALPPSPAITLSVYATPPYAGTQAFVATHPYATTWANLTLPRPSVPVTANVTDAVTGLPIAGATVYVYWYLGSAYGTTDASGMATVNAGSGLTISMSVGAVGYASWYGIVTPFQGVYRADVPLYPSLTANVTVEGYVRDASTNTTLSYVTVSASGYGNNPTTTYSDYSGFYTLDIVPRPQAIGIRAYGYAAGSVQVNPSPGETIWLNLSVPRDTVAPAIASFTANPSSNLGPSNPTTLRGVVNETSFAVGGISIYRMQSSVGNVGTFVNLGSLPSTVVALGPSSPGNTSVTARWDTESPILHLYDGVSDAWWPAATGYYSYQAVVSGSWFNATYPGGVYSNAFFDRRSGALLYIQTAYGFVAPQDQPTSTFQPFAGGFQIDLTTATLLTGVSVRAPAFQVGSLALTYAATDPGGQYAAVLETYDAGYNVARAAVLLSIVVDSTPPVARAGPDRTVDQHTAVTFDGTGSTDNVGVASYTWRFADGGLRVLTGATPTYTFDRAGAFTVTLTVTDAAGNSATDSLLVTVRDITPPTVAITAPTGAANVSGSISIVATVSDNVGVVRVEFLVDGASLGSATAAPFQVNLNTATLPNGAHTLTAVAYDAAGNSATATQSITVYNAPGTGGVLGLDLTMWIVLLAVIAAAAIGGVVLLLRRRRPRQVPPPPPGTSGP